MWSKDSMMVDFGGYIERLRRSPDAAAVLRGSEAYRKVTGLARFLQTGYGVLVEVSVSGLPQPAQPCRAPFFGCHLHEGETCGSDSAMGDPSGEAFAAAMGHYDPHGCDHPHHAGDMPPIMGCGGHGYQMFFTDRFELDDVLGRTMVIHAMPDDFSTQPAGASGTRIACGVIEALV